MKSISKMDRDRGAAMVLREALVNQVLTEPDYGEFRTRVKELFEAGIDENSIGDVLQEYDPLAGKSRKERGRIIALIVIDSVSEATRLSLINRRRTKRILSLDRQLTDDERMRGKLVRGYIVWTAEEEYYFFNVLIPDQTLRRNGGRMNHPLLAEKMNDRFQTTKFTPETSQYKYRNRNRTRSTQAHS